eukprot:9147606-Pyramimonas_sp.AAC.1
MSSICQRSLGRTPRASLCMPSSDPGYRRKVGRSVCLAGERASPPPPASCLALSPPVGRLKAAALGRTQPPHPRPNPRGGR